MTKRTFSTELKEQILKECKQVGNVSLVARRHDISKSTIYTWISKEKKNGSIKSLPKDEKKRLEEIKKRLYKVSTENNQLKKLLGEKELELAVLRDLRDTSNPL